MENDTENSSDDDFQNELLNLLDELGEKIKKCSYDTHKKRLAALLRLELNIAGRFSIHALKILYCYLRELFKIRK